MFLFSGFIGAMKINHTMICQIVFFSEFAIRQIIKQIKCQFKEVILLLT